MPNNSSTPQPAAPAAPVAPQVYPPDAYNNFNPNTALWNPYNARALAYTSALAYEQPAAIPAVAATWGFQPDRVTVIDPTTSVLQAIVLGRDDLVVLAFRGTRSTQMADWMADFEIFQSPFTKYFTAPNVGGVHDGFAQLLAKSWKVIEGEVLRCQDDTQTLWITGHSLGGALAAMATAAVTFAARQPVNGLYTFGQPRIGDLGFCTQCDSQFGDAMFRFVNNEDIVTRVPPRIVPRVPLPDFYGHFGLLRFFDGDGALHSDDHWWNSFLIDVDVGFEKMGPLLAAPVEDHLLKNYIANIEKYIAAGAPPL
jgi:triacylglycerol lipase